MFKKTLVAAVVLGLSSTAVQAYEMFGQEVSGYVTGSVGQAKAEKSKAAKELRSNYGEMGSWPGVSSRTSTDRTDTAYKFGLGLQANQYVAFELQYIDLGEASYKGRVTSPFVPGASGSSKLKSETSGFGANVVGTYPIEDFTLFAKAGYHYLKTKNSIKEGIVGVGLDGFYDSTSKTVRKWTPSFGVGASYNITPEFAVVAEYERYSGVADKKISYDGDKFNMKHDVDFASIGLRYNF